MEGSTMFKNQKPQYYNDVNSPQIENRLCVIPVKILEIFFFFLEIDKLIVKYLWKLNGKEYPKGGKINYMLLDIKTYDKAVLIKSIWS